MLNAADAIEDPTLNVVDYANPAVADAMANGVVNTEDAQILANIQSSIRRGHTQFRPSQPRHTANPNESRICLVGSGPSLADSFAELQKLAWEGATVVTMNGAYHYCIERGLRPQTQIVMDARPSNARFLNPDVPRCNYLVASQCAPETWDVVEGRPHVMIFHAVTKKEGANSDALDAYYNGMWVGIGGGTTVVTRSISLLRMAGYLRFDLFGIDCCWSGDQHHAMSQPENARDKRTKISAGMTGQPETMREFWVSPWHMKQTEDLLVISKVNGKHLVLMPHGDGMFTHLLSVLGSNDVDSLVLEQE